MSIGAETSSRNDPVLWSHITNITMIALPPPRELGPIGKVWKSMHDNSHTDHVLKSDNDLATAANMKKIVDQT